MIAKFAILLFAGACLAFPADVEQKPPSPQDIPQLQEIKPPSGLPAAQAVPVPLPEGFQPEGPTQDGPAPPQEGPALPQDGPVPPQGLPGGKDGDLKTDSSYWYRKSYYPVYYGNYYRPRSYSYSYYTPYYTYWNNWW